MQEQMLITYLTDICELEKEKKITEKAMKAISIKYQKTNKICHYYKSWEPYTLAKPSVSKTSLIFCIISLIISFIFPLLNLLLPDIKSSMPGFTIYGFLFFVITSLIAGCIYIYNFLKIETKYQKEAKKVKIENEKNSARTATLVKYNETAMEIFNQNFRVLKNAHNNINKTLSEMYGLNIIHPKYQYLEACGMFLEYFEAGRTHSLGVSGADRGAYNIFETELYHQTIIDKLDHILENQQVLIKYQREILRTANEIVDRIDDVCEKMRRDLNQIHSTITQVHGTLEQIHSTEKYIEFYNSVMAYISILSKRL